MVAAFALRCGWQGDASIAIAVVVIVWQAPILLAGKIGAEIFIRALLVKLDCPFRHKAENALRRRTCREQLPSKFVHRLQPWKLELDHRPWEQTVTVLKIIIVLDDFPFPAFDSNEKQARTVLFEFIRHSLSFHIRGLEWKRSNHRRTKV